MDYDNEVIRIGKIRNGYEVECLDPAIVAANDKPRKGNAPVEAYRSPWVCYAFDTKEQMMEFIEDAIDLVKPRRPTPPPSDTFEAAFKEATSGEESDDD